MASEWFVAATEELDSGEHVVSVMGEVDHATAASLEQTLLDVAADPTDEVIIDLTACRFLDSGGLRALLAARASREHGNRRPAIVLSNPSLLRIFQITQFDELFEIYPSLRAAVQRNGNGTRRLGRPMAAGG